MSTLNFKERSKIAKEILSKQSPVTLEDAKQQVARLKRLSSSSKKKKSI